MKRIPERFELTQDDIKEAIAYWLNAEHATDSYQYDFNIEFKTETVDGKPPKGAPVGGMSDYRVTVISAIAMKEE